MAIFSGCRVCGSKSWDHYTDSCFSCGVTRMGLEGVGGNAMTGWLGSSHNPSRFVGLNTAHLQNMRAQLINMYDVAMFKGEDVRAIVQEISEVEIEIRKQGGSTNGTRGTNPQIHSGTVNAANSPYQGAINPGSITAYAGAINQSVAAAFEPSIRNPLENTGVKVGEITAYRIWGVNKGFLMAYSNGNVWAPGEPMEGEPDDYDHAGVWCFKRKENAIKKMLEEYYGAYVYGSIVIWGKIIEHELGYRAEFGKITSLLDGNEKVKPSELVKLREKYAV